MIAQSRRLLPSPSIPLDTIIASDSGVQMCGEDVPHPPGYGNNARIARYVRELHVLRLGDAIRRMTSLPATTFGLKNRGFVREGCWADLVVFDQAEAPDNAAFDLRHHYATGFAHVFVNRVEVVRTTNTRGKTGAALRRNAG